MTKTEFRSPGEHVPAIAGVLASEHFPTGERAALKRMALDGPAPLAFHRFLLRHIDERWHAADHEMDWRALVCALALQRDGGYDPKRPFGEALADARFSEARMERLLSASGETLRALTLRAARHLAARGGAADWRQVAELLFCRRDDFRETINRRIARSYYRTLQSLEEEE